MMSKKKTKTKKNFTLILFCDKGFRRRAQTDTDDRERITT